MEKRARDCIENWAPWLFVIWGAWHGLLLVLTHSLKRVGLLSEKPALSEVWIRRQVTFLLIVVGWIFFRSADVHSGYGVRSVAPAFTMMKQMTGLGPKATPITYQGKNGKQYVAILAGGGETRGPDNPGGRLYVFALP